MEEYHGEKVPQKRRMSFPPVISIGEVSALQILMSMVLGGITAQSRYKKDHLLHQLWPRPTWPEQQRLCRRTRILDDAGGDQSRESRESTAKLRGGLGVKPLRRGGLRGR